MPFADMDKVMSAWKRCPLVKRLYDCVFQLQMYGFITNSQAQSAKRKIHKIVDEQRTEKRKEPKQ